MHMYLMHSHMYALGYECMCPLERRKVPYGPRVLPDPGCRHYPVPVAGDCMDNKTARWGELAKH